MGLQISNAILNKLLRVPPLIHEVMMACPSFLAVLKQFRACSGDVPGMIVVIACTTIFSVCLS